MNPSRKHLRNLHKFRTVHPERMRAWQDDLSDGRHSVLPWAPNSEIARGR
jgi:hypothetical protein